MTPSRFGPYVVERELGKGGMATVLLVRHEMTGVRYALKLLSSGKSDLDLHQRFEREARALATLSGHPYIMSVHAYGFEGGSAWYVMDLVEGLSLDEIVRKRGPISIRAGVKLGAQIANALAAAHGQGIIHRDVKPGNIMVVGDLEKPDGRALLCDFGLALAAGDDRLTRTGELVGTPAFLAPEQAKNKGQGPPVDIFALGGVLHFALTGRLAHGADAKMWHAVVMAIMKNPAEPLRSVRAEVPEELEKIVLRCLEKDPANRFPSAGVLEYALLDCLRAGRTAQRRRAGVILAAAAVAGGVGAAVALRGHGGGGGQPPPAPVVTTSSPTTPTDPGAGLKECVRTKNWKGAVACLDGLPGWPLQERLDFGTQALATDPSLAVKIAVGGARRIVGDDDEDRPDLEAFLHQVFAQTPEASVGAVALAALAAGLDLGPDRQRIALDIASFADESAPGLKERVLATLACGEPVEGRFRSKAGLREPSQNLSITERVDRDAWPKPSGTPNPIEQLADARWFARNGGEEASRRAQALIENARLGLEGHHEHDDDVEAAVLELEIARSPVEALAKLGDARSLQRQILRAQASRAVAERETDEAKRREAEDVAVQRWRALIDANPKDDYLLAFAHASLARLEHHLGHEHPARAWYARARIAVESGTAELDKVAAEIFEKQR